MSLWLAVKVVCCSRVLFGSKIIDCTGVESFGTLLSTLGDEHFVDRCVVKVTIKDGKGHQYEVQLGAPLSLCGLDQFHCKAVVFQLAELEASSTNRESSSSPNAFEILMRSQRRILLPQKVSSDTMRADQKMYNDVIDLLASWNVGWSPDSVETVGKRCVKTIVGALWYLDPHHERFSARSLASPASFHKFKGYNDWKRKREKCPQLTQHDLDKHVQAISSLLSQPWSHMNRFKKLKSELVTLVDVMKQYLSYLKKHSDAMKEAHSSTSVLHSVEENILLENRMPTLVCQSEYHLLQEKLLSLPAYHPVFVNDYSSPDRFERRHWLDRLQVELPIKMYRFFHGNSLGTLTFVWKLPSDGSEDPNATAQAISLLNSKQKCTALGRCVKTS